jgi:hypothetical protein
MNLLLLTLESHCCLAPHRLGVLRKGIFFLPLQPLVGFFLYVMPTKEISYLNSSDAHLGGKAGDFRDFNSPNLRSLEHELYKDRNERHPTK